MKKRLITLFMVLILFVIATGLGSSASTASKVETTRAIAIVFDNSGSMYSGGNKAWCQATYAMEVFASMLNSEDILQIYPMWPIEVNGKEYTMEQPFEIKGSSQASAIREIYTPSANTTPIESIDCAIEGIATFAHELTHIWQYVNWDSKKDFPKCPKDKHLLIYEGMAKWVEIQYLYLVGETNVAKREEAITQKREDEYGIGFCMYEDKYPLSRDTMICNETPFTVDTYPID